MGMDVYGRNADSPAGEYFRRNVWGWRPLVEAIEAVCLKEGELNLYHRCGNWQMNDGDGLNGADSIELATILENSIKRGFVTEYFEEREKALDDLPDIPCDICRGSGIRKDAVGINMGQVDLVIPADARDPTRGIEKPHPRAGQTGWCNGCGGTGYKRPWDCAYHATTQDVQEFVEFLKHCGGFEIC